MTVLNKRVASTIKTKVIWVDSNGNISVGNDKVGVYHKEFDLGKNMKLVKLADYNNYTPEE